MTLHPSEYRYLKQVNRKIQRDLLLNAVTSKGFYFELAVGGGLLAACLVVWGIWVLG